MRAAGGCEHSLTSPACHAVATAALLRGRPGEIYLAADDQPLTREQICIEACRMPSFAGRKVPNFTGPGGGGGKLDYGPSGVGKIIDCSGTRAALSWQPAFKTFAAFVDTLV